MTLPTEDRKIVLNWRTILIFVAIVIGLLATGLFGGYKYAKKQETLLIDTFSYKIDSLNKVSQIYQDSITRLNVRDEEAERVVVRWKIRYDTIRPKQDVDDLLEGLNDIGKTNPR